MAAIKKYKPGEFCWADVGTKDVAGAKKFYRSIFGWDVKDLPMGPGQKYSMLRVRRKEVCALYPMDPEQKKAKMPSFWLPYISVVNVDRTVKKARAAGGKLCMGPMDVMGAGRMAILLDPTGACFAIWQARGNIGTKVRSVPGTICWHDLSTPDKNRAGKFYTKVFGWKIKTMDFSGNSYHMFKLGGEGLGGMWPTQTPGGLVHVLARRKLRQGGGQGQAPQGKSHIGTDHGPGDLHFFDFKGSAGRGLRRLGADLNQGTFTT